MQVAEMLSRTKDMAIQAHARDELGIDLEDLDEKTNPWQVDLTLLSLPFCFRTCSTIAAPRNVCRGGHITQHTKMHKQTPVVDLPCGKVQ